MGKKDVLSTFFYVANPPNSRNGSTPLIWKAWQKGNWWGNYKSKQQTQQLLRRRLDNALCKEEKRGEKPGSAGEVVERADKETQQEARSFKWENTREMGWEKERRQTARLSHCPAPAACEGARWPHVRGIKAQGPSESLQSTVQSGFSSCD